jgi:hypothetical protein
MQQRLADRTKNSGDVKHADVVSTGDKGIRTNVQNTRNQQYGEGHPGEGSIIGTKRTTV